MLVVRVVMMHYLLCMGVTALYSGLSTAATTILRNFAIWQKLTRIVVFLNHLDILNNLELFEVMGQRLVIIQGPNACHLIRVDNKVSLAICHCIGFVYIVDIARGVRAKG